MTIERDDQALIGPEFAQNPATAKGSQVEDLLKYRGVDIHIAVQRTPDYVFGRADLVSGDRYFGRLSVGNPKCSPAEVQKRLAALAQARVDILKAAEGSMSAQER
jgi:hypothetical protein